MAIATTPALTERERAALHRAELGTEWLRRTRGSLVEFHHATGHGMNYLRAAETALRDCGHTDLADDLRDDLLPRGVVEDRWSYDLLESFEAGLLTDATAYERRLRDRVADGERHITEREQERAWHERAESSE